MAVKIKTVAAVTVATAGTRQQVVANSMLVYGATLKSLNANTGTQYVGDETVDSSNGMPFQPGDAVEIDAPATRGQEQFDLSKIYVDSSTNGAVFRIVAWIRE